MSYIFDLSGKINMVNTASGEIIHSESIGGQYDSIQALLAQGFGRQADTTAIDDIIINDDYDSNDVVEEPEVVVEAAVPEQDDDKVSFDEIFKDTPVPDASDDEPEFTVEKEALEGVNNEDVVNAVISNTDVVSETGEVSDLNVDATDDESSVSRGYSKDDVVSDDIVTDDSETSYDENALNGMSLMQEPVDPTAYATDELAVSETSEKEKTSVSDKDPKAVSNNGNAAQRGQNLNSLFGN